MRNFIPEQYLIKVPLSVGCALLPRFTMQFLDKKKKQPNSNNNNNKKIKGERMNTMVVLRHPLNRSPNNSSSNYVEKLLHNCLKYT